MAIDRKRAEKARESQLESFLKPQTENVQETTADEGVSKQEHSHEKTETKRKKTNSDYIRLDVADYKEYLQMMAGYDSMKSGKSISVTKYIQSLISADMDSRKVEYEKAKNI